MKYGLPLSLSLAIALVACAPIDPAMQTASSSASADATIGATAAPIDAAQLQAHLWQLHDARDASGQPIDALMVRKDKPLQLQFAQGRVSVRNACNILNGDYHLEKTSCVSTP